MKRNTVRYSDRELIEGLERHDEDVIQYLYDNAGPMVYKLILKAGGNADVAEDIFQEGILATYLNIRTGRYQKSANTRLTTYLVQICRYQWTNYMKNAENTRRPLESHPDIAEPLPEMDASLREERIRLLHDYIGQTGENCRKILRLFYWEKKSYEEIAREMEMTPESAKNQKYRCMKKLKELASGK